MRGVKCWDNHFKPLHANTATTKTAQFDSHGCDEATMIHASDTCWVDNFKPLHANATATENHSI